MVSNATEVLMGRMQSALVQAMPTALAPTAEAIQERVGVPVQRIGNRVIRSRPGEPPRRDTGALQASVEPAAIEAGDVVRGSVSVGVPYARRLNDQMDRPIAGDVPERTLPEALDVLARAITESNR